MKKLLLCLLLTALFYSISSGQANPSPKSLPGEAPRFYSSDAGDQLEETLIYSIKEAKESVVLLIYSLKSPKIIAALNERAKKGIPVKVIYDAEASNGVYKKLAKEVKKFPRGSDGLMHLKLLVIDGKETWLGSANMTGDSLKIHANLINHIDSPEFAKAIIEKADQLSKNAYEKPIPPKLFNIGGQPVELRFLPDDPEAVQKIKDLLRSAQKSIRVAMYTFTREDMASTLIRQAKRGIDVRVFMDKSTSMGASKKILAMLREENIPVTFYSNETLMHHKFVLIDDQTLVHGSANFTKAAFKQNDDFIMILYNLTKNQVKVLHAILKPLGEPT